MIPPEERPTLGEICGGTRGNPWACPRCGCSGPHKVVNSYMAYGDRRQRRRVCRNCGQGLLHTSEVPVPDGFKVVVVPEDEEPERACA